MRTIKIVQYGGNVGSIINIFNSIGYPASIATTLSEIIEADLVVLPGVGSAQAAIKSLHEQDLLRTLHERNAIKKPIVGVCLGAQIMFDYLSEAESSGLGWLEGNVSTLGEPLIFNNGWCHLNFTELKKTGLSRGLNESSTYYFNHQYYISPNSKYVTATIKELNKICAIVTHQHLCGIQFHPEKSQKMGKILLRNLIEDYYGL
jgi:glutamine amidotransferase